MKTNYFILLVLIVTIDAMAGIEFIDKDMKQDSCGMEEFERFERFKKFHYKEFHKDMKNSGYKNEDIIPNKEEREEFDKHIKQLYDMHEDKKEILLSENKLGKLAKRILTMAVMGNTESPKLELSTKTFFTREFSYKKIHRMDTIKSEVFSLEFYRRIEIDQDDPEPEESEWLKFTTLKTLTIPGLHISYYEDTPPVIYTCPDKEYKEFSYSDKSWVEKRETVKSVLNYHYDPSQHYLTQEKPIFTGNKEVIIEYQNKASEWLWLAYQCPELRPSDAKNPSWGTWIYALLQYVTRVGRF